jgi:hypothetical protein
MDDADRPSGRFWYLAPDEESEQERPLSDPARVRRPPLSLAAERWLGLAAIVSMIGLSDLLMYRYWH